MSFYSGFSLEREEALFDEFRKCGNFVVSGFSLGAIRAFEFVFETKLRVDTLQLFSPAFFQNTDEKFKRLQIISYQKNQKAYEEQFLKNIAYPSTKDMKKYFNNSDRNSLQELLSFIWEKEKLKELKDRGVEIEVYLGGKDKIIDTKIAYDFFKNYATVYFIKKGGHILHGKS